MKLRNLNWWLISLKRTKPMKSLIFRKNFKTLKNFLVTKIKLSSNMHLRSRMKKVLLDLRICNRKLENHRFSISLIPLNQMQFRLFSKTSLEVMQVIRLLWQRKLWKKLTKPWPKHEKSKLLLHKLLKKLKTKIKRRNQISRKKFKRVLLIKKKHSKNLRLLKKHLKITKNQQNNLRKLQIS